jgi:hypothetical protein
MIPFSSSYVAQSTKPKFRTIQEVSEEDAIKHVSGTEATAKLLMKMTLLGMKNIMTFEPENVKAILATQFNDFAKGELFHKSWYEVPALKSRLI